jgi:hypothetical protein
MVKPKCTTIKLTLAMIEFLNKQTGKTYDEKLRNAVFKPALNQNTTDITKIELIEKRLLNLEQTQMTKDRVERIVAIEISNYKQS